MYQMHSICIQTAHKRENDWVFTSCLFHSQTLNSSFILWRAFYLSPSGESFIPSSLSLSHSLPCSYCSSFCAFVQVHLIVCYIELNIPYKAYYITIKWFKFVFNIFNVQAVSTHTQQTHYATQYNLHSPSYKIVWFWPNNNVKGDFMKYWFPHVYYLSLYMYSTRNTP